VNVCTKTLFAIAVAIALAAVACDGGGGSESGQETPPDPSFLDPITARKEGRDVFVVEADDAEYWRMFTLDTYDGESWTGLDEIGSMRGVRLTTPARLPRAGGHAPPRARFLDQTFRILGDVGFARALPMAQTAEEIGGPIGDITWDPARSVAFIDGALELGTTYTVRSRIVVPTAEQLDRVEHLAPSKDDRWTALPPDLDPRIAQIAERWTSHATSDYRKVLAIQQRFHRGDFVYRTAVDAAVDDDAVVEFLTKSKAGFCQHYSSAMAVMVRTLGLPARIGGGFRVGTQQASGTYLVSNTDAHVWVEVLFPRYGWLQFEPEPGTDPHPNAQPGTYLNPGPPVDTS
jgi:Transglutaminase-like superfamily/TgpA N-terminal domain